MAPLTNSEETEEATPVEAASIQPFPSEGKQKTITAKVTAPFGSRVPKSSVLQTAIQSVRDAIPVVFKLDAEITGSQIKELDGEKVCEWEVTITYTPRAVAGKTDPVDLDKVVRGLDVPRSFDGIASHTGDPDFLNPQGR